MVNGYHGRGDWAHFPVRGGILTGKGCGVVVVEEKEMGKYDAAMHDWRMHHRHFTAFGCVSCLRSATQMCRI
jgi:hypothetical protein